jgi:hypothetical protein
MNSKNYTHCRSENPHTVHEIPLHDTNAASAHKIKGPMVFKKINSDQHILSILKIFFRELMDEDISHFT